MSAVILVRRAVAAVAMNRSFLRVACVLLAVSVLAGCGHSRVVKREGGAPPTSASRGASSGATTYVVRRGDTLYGIAFRHGLDYRDVAALNRIPAPYTIYPGQRLSLRAGTRSAATSRGTSSRPPAAVASGGARATRPVSTPRPTGSPTPVASGTSGARTGPAPMIPPPLPTTPTPPPTAPMATVPGAGAISPTGWRWPTQGTLIGRFAAGDPKRQGVDIAGTAGQAVVAAADGTVVYSGAGLVGYGELIIVKHSDEWLSAYAHNRRRLVVEGTVVKGGQPIAERGRSGTSRDMLHFEVRRNGKPVDPLTVLPPH